MSAELVGPLRPVWFADDWRPRYYDLPGNTRDIRYSACASHHPACDCREASIAESFAEHKAEIDELYNAVLEAIKGHNTYPVTTDGRLFEFEMCKCAACGIARKAHVGYWQHKDERRRAGEQAARDAWLRVHRATLAPAYPAYPYADIEVPF